MSSDAEISREGHQWTQHQQLFLDILQVEGNGRLSVTALCRKAGFSDTGHWYRAAKNEEFKKAAKALRDADQQLEGHQEGRKLPQWGETHQRLLDVLQVKENRGLTIPQICQKAGFSNHGYWYRALEHPQFKETAEALGVPTNRQGSSSKNQESEESELHQGDTTPQVSRKLPPRSQACQRLLDLLQVEENRQISPTQLCQKAGYASKRPWYRALEYPEFKEAVEALGVPTNRLGFYFNDKAIPKVPQWSQTHQRLLDVLQVEENRQLSVVDLCHKAGFTHLSGWYRALEHPQFRAAVEDLGVPIERLGLYLKGQSKAQRAILAVLQDEANRRLPIIEICRKAGYSDDYWYKSLQSEDFVQALQVLGVEIRRIEHNENGWTDVQQSLLDVLQEPANRELSITEICHLAGYPNCTYWFRARKNPQFREAVEALGIKHWTNRRNEHGFTRAQQRFLDFLEKNPIITAGELCRQLGYVSTSSWTEVLQDHRFIQELEARGIQVERKERLKDGWTWGQREILSVLQDEANRELPIRQVCRLAGYSTQVWYQGVQNELVISALKDLSVRIQRIGTDEEGWTWAQQRLLAVLQDETNRDLPVLELCRKAHYSSVNRWYASLTHERFTQVLQTWGVPFIRQHPPFISHIHVELAMNIEEELSKDVWDIRRLKSDYPKHRPPSSYIVDFTWIENLELRQQIKLYLRAKLPRWRAGTFSRYVYAIRGVFSYLPTDVHIGTITRQHIEAILPEVLVKSSDVRARGCLGATRAMFQDMVHSRTWRGPRPPNNLIDCKDIPSADDTLPRPIPPEVLAQFDFLLEQAIQNIIDGQTPPLLEPILWDAILILRRTGMRFADLAHLEAPNARNRGGCLGQDADGDYWIHIRAEKTKMGREHQIPTMHEDGIVQAILRQNQRAQEVPDHFGESYLFRTDQGILAYGAMCKALAKLGQHLTYLGQPYPISPHQFRHTIATDMIDKSIDVVAVKEFIGHRSLTMTMRYVKVYKQTVRAKYKDYLARTAQQSLSRSSLPTQQFWPGISSSNPRETDIGWVAGYEGKLYRFGLLNGLGICEQTPGLQLSCIADGQCSTKCPKLRAGKQHLSAWEERMGILQRTIETIQGCPGYEWSCQQHEQELRQTEKVIATIQKEGFWDGRFHNVEKP